jgi:hypothetical protein
MAIFTVLEPPDGRVERTTFVKDGFAWGAFAFTVLWALWHRMWIVAAVLFALFVGISLAVSELGLDPALALALELGVSTVLGFEARTLHVMALKRAGYSEAGLVEATTLEAAELDYFSRRRSAAISPRTSAFIPRADDTLGIFGNV